MLADLIIDKTEYTPSIAFSITKEEFLIMGEARPENAGKFFEPVLAWLKHFSETAHNDVSYKQNKNNNKKCLTPPSPKKKPKNSKILLRSWKR
ncbi:MAG: SiaC family regulatory phosphoprotein, partial [Bacteroidia bacterium]